MSEAKCFARLTPENSAVTGCCLKTKLPINSIPGNDHMHVVVGSRVSPNLFANSVNTIVIVLPLESPFFKRHALDFVNVLQYQVKRFL